MSEAFYLNISCIMCLPTNRGKTISSLVKKSLSVIMGITIVILCATVKSREGHTDVTVFAAVSLTEVLQAIYHTYRQESDTLVVHFSFAASSVLARQIETGAPVDIFISAHPKWMDRLQNLYRIDLNSRVDLAYNRLVVIAPSCRSYYYSSDQDVSLHPFDVSRHDHWMLRLGKDGRIAVGDPDHVPAGIYAQAALIHFNLWSSVQDRLARTEHVRGALTLVSRGEVPLGIVYATDARISDQVQIIDMFPDTSHPSIRYPMGMVSGRRTHDVQEFYHYLLSDMSRQIYRHYGFSLSN